MTPKEKAKELVDKMYDAIPLNGFVGTYLTFRNHAKQCALIAVDEIIKSGPRFPTKIEGVDIAPNKIGNIDFNADFYWLFVKEEIEKL